MKAFLGVKDGRPYIHLESEDGGEWDMLEYMASWLPLRDMSAEGGNGWRIVGDRLPGSGKAER